MAQLHEADDETLERAWRELAKPDWPSLSQLKHAAARYAIVRARASAMASGRAAPAPTEPRESPAPEPTRRAAFPPLSPAPLFDQKRAASGEREDD